MKDLHFGALVAFLFVAVVVFVKWQIPALDAQEKPERPTRTWQILTLPREEDGWLWQHAARIDVVDTAGVCLYVARSTTSRSPSLAMVAVPKTQLPQGAGCQ